MTQILGTEPHLGPTWVRETVWWHVYPLGFTGAFPLRAPEGNHSLMRIIPWLDHAVELGASGLALGPIFASHSHGYDTLDYFSVDPRLGTTDDFTELVAAAHARGMRVLLDGVFNHMSQQSLLFQNVLAGRATAVEREWFIPVEVSEGTPDGFATFEGHPALVTLNHANPEVADFVARVMSHWLDRGADGWRLDAAYAVPPQFWASVIPSVRQQHPDSWFVGEVIHGDYAGIVELSTMDSVTQYELWKAIWSSLNDGNFFELAWALTRHQEFLEAFVPLTFVGNHDVTRLASVLDDPRHIAHALVVLMTVGGIPSIYAGDELALTGTKEERSGGDDAIRPEFAESGPAELPDHSAAVFETHRSLIALRHRYPWLYRANTETVELENTLLRYASTHEGTRIEVALNIGDEPCLVSLSNSLRLIASDEATRAETATGALASTERGSVLVHPHGYAIAAPSVQD